MESHAQSRKTENWHPIARRKLDPHWIGYRIILSMLLEFRCIPTASIYSQVIASLSSFEWGFYYASQLTQDTRHCLPYDAQLLKSVVIPGRPWVTCTVVERARDRMISLGIYARHVSQRKVWLEITPEHRHSAGNNTTGFGDYSQEPQQMEMTMPVVLKSPRQTRDSRLRVEKEENRYPDSAREKNNGPYMDSVNQDLSIVDEETDRRNRFAAGKETMPDDPLWLSLIKAVNPSEMMKNGLLWKKRILEERDAMTTALSDWWAMKPENRAKYNAAAYITTAFENEKRKFG